MKKFLALSVAAFILLVSVTGCKSKEAANVMSSAAKVDDTSATQPSSKAEPGSGSDTQNADDGIAVSSDDCFYWGNDSDFTTHNDIITLTAKGLKQKHLVIPERATRLCENALSNRMMQNSTVAAETISFKNPDTVLGEQCMAFCKHLTTVSLPKHLKKLAKGMFNECEALKDIEMPDSLTTLEDEVFENCVVLENITIPNGVAKISKNCFSGCTALTKITIPRSVTEIETYAFASCNSLKTIDLPSSVNTIDDSAFFNCISLTSLVIPEGVTHIGQGIIDGDTALKTIKIPSSATDIELGALNNDTASVVMVKKGSTADKNFKFMCNFYKDTKEYY